MAAYQFLAFFCTALTLLGILVIFFRRRYLFLTPSVAILVAFHCRIQWSAAMEASAIFHQLYHPWDFFLLTFVLPLAVCATRFMTPCAAAVELWQFREQSQSWPSYDATRWLMRLCLAAAGFIVVYYLVRVRFDRTALFALIKNTGTYTAAREESLKLVSDPIARYLYEWHLDFLGAFTAGLLTVYFLDGKRYAIPTSKALVPFGYAFVIISVSFSGARSGVASVVLLSLFVIWLRRGMPVAPLYLSLAAILVLLGPVVLTIWREGLTFTFENIGKYYDSVWTRNFVTTMKTGLYHVDYVQRHGVFGIHGVRPLAILADARYDPVNNIIGLNYMQGTLATVVANTCFVYDYYACFGMLTIFLSFVLWLSLDLALRFVPSGTSVAAAFIGGFWLLSQSFISSAFTTALLSHGFLPLVFLAYLANRRIGRSEDVPAESYSALA